MNNKRGPKKAVSITTTNLCKFGCGQLGKFESKNGIMCANGAAGCPTNKKKNREGLIRKHEEMRVKNGKAGLFDYSLLTDDVKNKMKVSKGLTKETSPSILRQSIRRHQNFLDGKWKPTVAGVALNTSMRWKRNIIPYIDSSGALCNLDSLHEWEVANLLDRAGVYWTRPAYLRLMDGRKYEPDFYLKEYDIYLDPKTSWKGKALAKYQGYDNQDAQLSKIKKCEAELGVKCLILWSEDKTSHTWVGILDQISNYLVK